MKMKKIPMRMCVVTREKCEKRNLIRVVKNKEGEVLVDLTGKINGRGAYIKKDVEVLNKARKNKILERTLEINISDALYDELEKIINE